ncbi:site-specific tyrosine recombinase XerD [Terrilactibacillus sp. BCM23-1]|uniref:Tyrosine recombinase XerC n=1 Tax=Terrilactibacillus tamarindi TaxID=2599694 RepID=A0A6N8CQJ5_9BACI|nr:site-specific tyrosine recombinase XerD [Terrilactibacillus tamarindi]MTT31215.1 site-specific tyrosine recombinase XerD [Terrilactibacillus tamarindi]
MQDQLDTFLHYLEMDRRLSENTREAYHRDLTQYIRFLRQTVHIQYWDQVVTSTISRYLYSLKDEGKAPATIARQIASIKGFHHYLLENRLMQHDPAYEINIPKVSRKFPSVLTIQEVNTLLDVPNILVPTGMRDRAILEVLYGAGIRATELIQLNQADVHLEMGFIRVGHGRNERVIPLGKPSIRALRQYINEGMPKLVKHKRDKDAFFVNRRGDRLTRQGLWKILKSLAKQAHIEKELTPHTLRHTFATHLIQNGADIISIQEMLGHVDISTTQIYASQVKHSMKDVFSRYHPRS